MRNLEKYKGVIPAFYACYDNEGNVSPEGVQSLTKYFVEKGVKGVYVNGSSGECIYQSVEDRKIILENVMKAAEGNLQLLHTLHAITQKTARNLQDMQRALELTLLQQFHRSISTCQSMQSLSTGMTLVRQHQTQTL